VVTSDASGTPRLLPQQLDENGESYADRVIVDEKLIAWRVETDGRATRVNPPALNLSQPPSGPQGESSCAGGRHVVPDPTHASHRWSTSVRE